MLYEVITSIAFNTKQNDKGVEGDVFAPHFLCGFQRNPVGDELRAVDQSIHDRTKTSRFCFPG